MSMSAMSNEPPTVQQSAKGRSAFGLFAQSLETEVAVSILKDLQQEAEGTDRILAEYLRVVEDDERRQRARQMLEKLADDPSADSLARLIEVLYFAGYQKLLRKYSLRFPAYNILDEFFVGSAAPEGSKAVERLVVDGRRWSVLGKSIGFPIGVPASVLTSNVDWINHFTNLSYNVLTTRTVRSRPWGASRVPNWVFVPSLTAPLALDPAVARRPIEVVADPHDWVDAGNRDVTTSNSFGVPSHHRNEWMADLRRTALSMHTDQLLIASVLGDVYESGLSTEDAQQALVNDFVEVALLAESCRVDAIELNVSCPNSVKPGGGIKPPLCFDLETTRMVVAGVRSRLSPSTKLVVKLSYLPDNELRELLAHIGPLVHGVAGINTLQSTVKTGTGDETFPGRPRAGVSGIAIRNYALDFVQSLVRIRLQDNYSFDIIGMGGVTDSDSFLAMYRAGAAVVQSASGAFANPFLAQECINTYGHSLTISAGLSEEGIREAARGQLLRVVGSKPGLTRYDLVLELGLLPPQTFELIDSLLKDGALRSDQGGHLASA